MEGKVLEEWRDRTAAIAAVYCKGFDRPYHYIESSISCLPPLHRRCKLFVEKERFVLLPYPFKGTG